MLFYNEIGHADRWWAFDVDRQAVEPVEELPATETPAPPPILGDLRELDVHPYLAVPSPTGDRVLYAVRVQGLATPTALSEELIAELLFDIYVLEEGLPSPVLIGRVEGTLDGFTWFPNGRGGLISLVHPTPNRFYLWVVELPTPGITTFAGEGATLYGVSPNGEWVLYAKEGRVRARNMTDGRDIGVPVEIHLRYVWWLPDSEGFIFLMPSADDPGLATVAVLDFASPRARLIASAWIRVYPGWEGSAILSPNLTTLAFIEEEPSRNPASLNILTLCLDAEIQP